MEENTTVEATDSVVVVKEKKKRVQTKENIEKVAELKAQGMTCKQIAVEMNLRYREVYPMLKKVGA